MALCSQKVYGIWVWCYLLIVVYRELQLHNMLVVHGRGQYDCNNWFRIDSVLYKGIGMTYLGQHPWLGLYHEFHFIG